ncbi:MAG: OmpA family protein [Bacteroidales bacterium]|jgi:outer membrane protein OmpA-like peptidoglycan-associated protein|nr:OmpA family protein [Bacteroidales bacterium]MCK9498754.1 OmpA family protein [Bacteroidales bacterium]MDY0314386.1 OmpA family protein [Bacteroidales bacterium]NLB86838.1 OmpA family protein [Bacteroidales bacterium]
MKIFYFIIFLLFNLSLCFSQNLVENASFENAWTCPESFTTFPSARPYPAWFNPSKGTPDQFHPCSLGDASVPFNFAGFMFPAHGQAYAGIILRETFDDSIKTYKGVSREYIQTKLLEPLEKEKLYCVKLSYANASKSLFSVDALGITLTNSKIGTKDAGLIIQRPQITNRPGHIMDNTDYWIEMCGVYRAYGGETYLTIGNFLDNIHTNFKVNDIEFTDSAFYYAYYYIDDVRVYKIENDFECACLDDLSFGSDWLADNYDPETGYNTKDILVLNPNSTSGEEENNTDNKSNLNNNSDNKDLLGENKSNSSENSNNENENSLKNQNENESSNLSMLNMKESEITEKAFEQARVGSKFNLNRIFFEFNSAELLALSYTELDKLVEILSLKSNLRIEVRGHTDNVGTESYNKSLSIKRAQAVYDYLISSGIDKKRMKYRGFGTKVPVASNDTEEGRSLNRRVEIIVVEL